MDQDLAILTAAFALRNLNDTESALGQELAALLPARLEDVPPEAMQPLGDRVLLLFADDPEVLAWFRASFDGLKSFGAISPLPVGRAYLCPFGDTPWSRQSILSKIPTCPTHGVLLQPKI